MNDNRNINQSQSIFEPKSLESLLDACRPADEVDTARIKKMVHARMMSHELQQRAKRNKLVKRIVAAAACVALVVGVAVKFMSSPGLDLSNATLAEVSDAGYIEMVVGAGNRSELVLSDGTKLIANSHTRVLYPEAFGEHERRIFVDGEAYLEVAKDASKPFIVESNGFDIKVLGTKFNVCNTSDSTAQIVLVEGSVEVTTDSNNRVRLKPNDMVDLENGEVVSLARVDTSEYTIWTNGLLSLHGEPLAELARRLSEHYGVEIRCDQSLREVKVYGKLDLHESIDYVLESIREIVPMEIVKDGDLIVIKGK